MAIVLPVHDYFRTLLTTSATAVTFASFLANPASTQTFANFTVVSASSYSGIGHSGRQINFTNFRYSGWQSAGAVNPPSPPDSEINAHIAFQTIGNSSHHSGVVSITQGNKGYVRFEPLSTVKNTGFEYFLFPEVLTTTITEFCILSDAIDGVKVTTTLEEHLIVSNDVYHVNNGTSNQGYTFPDTLKPLHCDFIGIGNSASHSNLKSIVSGPKAYTNFQSVQTSSSHDNTPESGYEYLPGDGSSTTLYEYFVAFDTGDSADTSITETFLTSTSLVQNVTTASISDYFLVTESATGSIIPRAATYDASMALIIPARKQYDPSFTTQVTVAGSYDTSFEIGMLADDFVLVTNASSLSNPTAPVLIKDGVVIYANPTTLAGIPDYTQVKGCSVAFSCDNFIDGVSADDVFSYNINIEGAGGNWSANTNVDLPDFGEEIQIIGLKGTVTKKGFKWSNSSGGYENAGILGSRNLNRQLAFLIYSNSSYFFNQVNQFVRTPDPRDWKTHKDACALISSVAGVTVSWHIHDFPLLNFQPQGSQSALSAIESLAEECGGIVRWSGNQGYKVVYPTDSLGTWTVPDCCLINAFSKECNLDLNTGFYNPGVRLVPQLGIFDPGTKQIATGDSSGGITDPNLTVMSAGQQSLGLVENINSFAYSAINQAIDPRPPSTIPLDLPLDTDKIFVQLRTSSDPIGPYTVIDGEDENKWFFLSGIPGDPLYPSSSNYVNLSQKGGQVKPVLNIDPSLFPTSNSQVDSSILRVGITRKAKPFVDTASGSNLLTAKTFMKYQWIPTCTYTVVCTFFGSLPMPGMTGIANFNGVTISGSIESVSLTAPDILTVNMVQWTRLDFYTKLDEYQNF